MHSAMNKKNNDVYAKVNGIGNQSRFVIITKKKYDEEAMAKEDMVNREKKKKNLQRKEEEKTFTWIAVASIFIKIVRRTYFCYFVPPPPPPRAFAPFSLIFLLCIKIDTMGIGRMCRTPFQCLTNTTNETWNKKSNERGVVANEGEVNEE